MRYLGIDWGTKYVGLAISDEKEQFSFPYKVLKNVSDNFLTHQIYKILIKEGITKVVVGLPVTLDGREGKASEKVIQFVEKMKSSKKFQGITFEFFDERLTTKLVEKELNIVKKRIKNRKYIINMATAQKILQDYLEFKKTRTE
ncbi:MAG: Holliday junction resolvase RuvX [Planctomycetota bacterium]